MKTPTTSYPCCFSNNAVTLESTPPDMPTTTRVLELSKTITIISSDSGDIRFEGRIPVSAIIAGQEQIASELPAKCAKVLPLIGLTLRCCIILPQSLSGARLLSLHTSLRRASIENLTAIDTSIRSHVNEPIGLTDDLQVMLNNDE